MNKSFKFVVILCNKITTSKGDQLDNFGEVLKETKLSSNWLFLLVVRTLDTYTFIVKDKQSLDCSNASNTSDDNCSSGSNLNYYNDNEQSREN